MTLTSDDVLRFLRLVPALASGLIAAALALLLARKTGRPLYRAFGWMLLSFLAYGSADFLTRLFWTHTGWSSFATKISGAADIFAVAAMVSTLARFAAVLLDRPFARRWRRLLGFPSAAAVLIGGLLFVPGVPWSEAWFGLTGLVFLGLLLAAAAVCGGLLVVGHRRLHDRPLRFWAWGMGLLILAFIPLWVLEVFRIVQWGGFAWFFTLFNLAGLVSMVHSHFQPESAPVNGALFEPAALSRCAARFGWTERETEVANLHARGLSSTDIAQKLFIAPKTVRNHVTNLYTKTGIHQRMALIELLARS